MSFKLPKLSRSLRSKDVYAGNAQLANQFSSLDSLLGDEHLRDILISHALIYSQYDFEPSKYARTKGVEAIKYDALRSYYESLHSARGVLMEQDTDSESFIYEIKDFVASYLSENSDLSNSPSPILTHLINHTNLFNLNNPSEYLRKRGGIIFRAAKNKGTLKGNRVIHGENYSAIIDSFKRV